MNNPESSNLSLNNTNNDAISFISLLVIMIFWVSLFSAGIFEIIGEIKGQAIILFLWLLTLFLFGHNALRLAFKKVRAHSIDIVLLIVFVLVNVVNMALGRGDMAYGNFVRSLILLSVFLSAVIHLKNDLPTYVKAVIFIIIFFGLISIYVLPILLLNPFIARMYEFSTGEIPWFGSWGFFMPIAISMPVFIAISLRQRGLVKILLCIICISICLMIILSTFAASIILLLLGCAFLLLFSVRNKKKLLLIIGIIFFAIVLLINQYDFSELPQLKQMVNKISTIFSYKSQLDEFGNDARGIRTSLMQVSIKTFLENPFFGVGIYDDSGNGNNVIGAHSGIIDGLAQYGIFGIMWYFGFILIGFRRLIIYFKSDPGNLINRARLITFLLYIIGAIANPVLIETSFCSLLLILALSPVDFQKIRIGSN